MALYPSEPALEHLAATVRGLRLGAVAASGVNVRLAARPLWHVTLAFLGEVPDDRAADARAALGEAVAGWRSSRRGPDGGAGPPAGPAGVPHPPAAAPTLRLAGGGRFGRGRATVLWVGMRGDLAAVEALARQVRRSLRRARLPCDRKPFRPHLTFARPGDRLPAADVVADLATLAAYEGPAWPLEEVHLIRSHLGPTPAHERLTSLRLA